MSIQLPSIKKRKLPSGPKAVSASMKRRSRKKMFTLSQTEFAERKRFIDIQGNEYALPREDDALYVAKLRSGMVDPIENLVHTDEDHTRVRSSPGKALLYIRKHRGKKISARPMGVIEILDLESKYIYTATVRMVMFDGDDKHGHMLVKDMTRTRRVRDQKRFSYTEK